MAPRKRGTTTKKRRTGQQRRQTAKPKRSTTSPKRGARPKAAAAKRQVGRKSQRASRPRVSEERRRQLELKRRIDELFEQQIEGLWSKLGHECREFAEGYNHEIGTQHLDVQQHPDGVLVKFAESGGEVGLQLDREHRQVTCYLHSGWTNLGSSIMESPPIGLTIHDGQLRLVYGDSIISEEDLAVRLLTDLTGGGESATP